MRNKRLEVGGWRLGRKVHTCPLPSNLQPLELERSDAIHAEGAGVATVQPSATSLAALLSRHVLRDGEIIILLLKPSLWFILLSSMRFAAAILL